MADVKARIGRLVVTVAVVAGGLALASQPAYAALHGITFVISCNTNTTVGAEVGCLFVISNNFDPDTLIINSISVTVHGAAGDDNAGNVLPDLDLSFTIASSCAPDRSYCTLDPGSSISTATAFPFHTTTASDFRKTNPLTVDATLDWLDICNSQDPGCPQGDQHSGSGSQTILQQPTTIAPAAANVVTGNLTAGDVSGLAAADNNDYTVTSTTTGDRIATFHARFKGVPTTPSVLKVQYLGSVNNSCRMLATMLNRTTGVWDKLGNPVLLGGSPTKVGRFAQGTLANYVSSTGNVDVRIRCHALDHAFDLQSDQLALAYG
jgi:hypothetical protein